jgi:predicted O-methyltransferase YrrM
MAQILAGDGKVVTIEVDRLIAATARKNIANAGLSDKVEIVTGNTIDLLPKLDLKFGLLFLDAAKNEYLTYLKLAEEKSLKKRAIIVADNVEVSKNEMLDYLKYVRLSGLYKSETIGTNWSLLQI